MSRTAKSALGKSAERLLGMLATRPRDMQGRRGGEAGDAEILIAADLAVRRFDGMLAITEPGRAHLARLAHARGGRIDPFLGQHLQLAQETLQTADGRAGVTVDAAESPLAWLARRKGRDGRALIEPVQLLAGERLRADFTRAQLMPRTTANWTSAVAQDRRSTSGGHSFSDAVIGARQCVRQALAAAGPEFIGLLVDVCCFLKGLEDVERERGWPPRSAKVVLQLGLDRLARHYGYGTQARGKARAPVRTWLADDAMFVTGE
jgi:hypothetical protein